MAGLAVELGAVEGLGAVAFFQRFVDPHAGAVHVQGLQQLLADEVLPTYAGQPLDEVSHEHIAQVVVLKAAAQFEVGLQETQVVHQLLPGEVRAVPGVLVARQAGSMAEQVARGDLRGGVVVHEPELGQVGDHGRVQVEQAALAQDHGGCGGEGLGAAADLKEGVAVPGLAVLVALADAGAQQGLPALQDAQREAGNVPGCDLLLRAGLQRADSLPVHGLRLDAGKDLVLGHGV